MKNIGKYSKAYLLNEVNKYVNFKMKVSTDKEYVFIQDDYTVTADVYKDERVIFDEVNEQWIDFCKSKLVFQFQIIFKSKSEGKSLRLSR